MMLKRNFTVDSDDLKRIDELASEALLSRSEYMVLSSIKRRSTSVITSPVLEYKFLSEIKSKLGALIHSVRNGEDPILDLLELETQTSAELEKCFERGK